MAKDKLTDYDSTASGNLDVGGISVAEGMLPSGVNNAIRELMSHQADAFGAGTPLYVDQTNNRLGINQATPAYPLHVGTDDLIVDASGNVLAGTTSIAVGQGTTTGVSVRGPIGRIEASASGNTSAIFNRTTSDGSIVNFSKDGSTVGSIGTTSSKLTIGSGATGVRFNYAGIDTIAPWNVSTNALTDGTTSLGYSNTRFNDLYLSGGVYLGGTGSANYLDDYEEGTWEPAFEAATTNPSVTYAYQYGYYTKIGDTVHVAIAIRTTAFSGGSGSLRLTLPFAITSSTVYRSSGYFAYNTILTNPSSGGTPMVYLGNPDAFLFFYNATTAGKSSISLNPGNASSGYLQMFATYKTSA